jgi:hypothetical protein
MTNAKRIAWVTGGNKGIGLEISRARIDSSPTGFEAWMTKYDVGGYRWQDSFRIADHTTGTRFIQSVRARNAGWWRLLQHSPS